MATEAMTSAPASFGRLFWMIVGPFALAICAVGIAQRDAGWFSPSDVFYFVVLGGMLIGRRVEFRYSRPTTATGDPATAVHLRRYTVWLTMLGLGIFVVAKLIANQGVRNLG